MNILFYFVLIVVVCVGCSDGTGNEKMAARLADEIVEEGFTSVEQALERVDSAEQADVFTPAHANITKAMIYANADQRRMAGYYAEKAINAENEQDIISSCDSSNYYTARWILADVACANGEYGKSLALAKEVLSLVGDQASSQNIAVKCKASFLYR